MDFNIRGVVLSFGYCEPEGDGAVAALGGSPCVLVDARGSVKAVGPEVAFVGGDRFHCTRVRAGGKNGRERSVLRYGDRARVIRVAIAPAEEVITLGRGGDNRAFFGITEYASA